MNMETNKTFAAFLIAGIIALTSGFISNILIPTETLAESAFTVEGVVASADSTTVSDSPAEASLEDMMAAADIKQGEKVFEKCKSCHTIDKGGQNKIGPNLHGVFGRAMASVDGFAYSSAMKAKGGKWTTEELNNFITNPRKAIPKNKMTFIGLKKAEDRAAVIKWLKEQK